MNQIKGLVIKKKQEVKKATRQSRLDTNNNNNKQQPWLLKTNQATHTRAQNAHNTSKPKKKQNCQPVMCNQYEHS
jgi:hypothetical protein